MRRGLNCTMTSLLPDIKVVGFVLGIISKEVGEEIVIIKSRLVVVDNVIDLRLSGVGEAYASW